MLHPVVYFSRDTLVFHFQAWERKLAFQFRERGTLTLLICEDQMTKVCRINREK